jgi:5-methylcytosine-specific restriction endonuclease McrA
LVWATTGGRCIYCCRLVDFSGLEAFHVDHFIPRSAGGSDRLENLVPACSSCNLSKGARRFHDWRALA